MEKQRIDQRSPAVACRRVNHHSPGLVDYQKVPILIDNVQGYVFRKDIQRGGIRDLHQEKIPHPQPVILPGRAAR